MKSFVMVLLLLSSMVWVDARPLIFAPLPLSNTQRVFEDFSPMIHYLEKHLGERIEFHYEKQYDTIVRLFQENKIDIAYFDPLPFIALHKTFQGAKPLITFHESGGTHGYRCVLVKFAGDKIDVNHSPRMKVALTQPLSTCGYIKTKFLLKEYYGKELDNMLFSYLGKHDEVALSVIRGDFLVGGVKESVAHEYATLGLEIITSTKMLPGFTLVVNTQTLTQAQIETIKHTLLSTPKEVYQTWGKELSYGMSEANATLFDALSHDALEFNVPPHGNYP